MPIVSLNTNPSFTARPPITTKDSLWNGRAVEALSFDSSCLTQKELHFSDYIAPETAPTTNPFQKVEVLFFEWKPEESNAMLYFTYSPQESDTSQESEWRFADRAPYIPKNYEENLTVEELLERTGYKFATFEDLETIQCKKVKDRVVGWWKSGVKWAKEHKKELIITGVVLGTGAFVAGVVLLVSAATAEAAVATTAAVGAAVAGGSGPKKKDEEEEKPPTPQETASEPPPPPPSLPSIDFPPVTEKPQPPKETASASPPSNPLELPSIGFQPPIHGKSPSSSYIPSFSPSLLPPTDFSFYRCTAFSKEPAK